MMEKTMEPSTEAAARTPVLVAPGAIAFRRAQASRRAAGRARMQQIATTAPDEALRRFDPLERSRIPTAASILMIGLLVFAGLALHGLIAAALFVASAMADRPHNPNDDPIEVAIVETAPEPVIEPEPVAEPEPEPEPEPEKAPEPEPEPEPPKPEPPKPKPKLKEPPPPDPINQPPEPPKEPPKEPQRRVVGINFESTVTGGDGPGFATGNTRMGETDNRAEDPNKVEKLAPGTTGGTPGASSGTPQNKVATRLPVQGDKFEKPKRNAPIRPAYPEMLRRRGIEADVTVLATINEKGDVVSVQIVEPSKYPEFNDAAKAAALKEKFVPATKNGEPTGWRLKYTYRFRLND